jgi:hypothetical protein
MKEYCFTIECERRMLTICYSNGELTFMVRGNPLIPAAADFKGAVGLWDNFSVGEGMDTRAWTTKSRLELLLAAQRFQEAIEVDRDVLQYDYQYGFSSIPKQKNSAAMTAGKVGGRNAFISAKHPGQLYLELWEVGPDGKRQVLEVKDLRKGLPVVTDTLGTIKVYRRKNKIDWEPKLLQLIEFLQSTDSEIVRIRHHYPE